MLRARRKAGERVVNVYRGDSSEGSLAAGGTVPVAVAVLGVVEVDVTSPSIPTAAVVVVVVAVMRACVCVCVYVSLTRLQDDQGSLIISSVKRASSVALAPAAAQ